ncbi:MAG: YraN family protein [Thermoplasmatales archaeon]
MRWWKSRYCYKRLFSIVCELTALVYLLCQGLTIWRWRWRSKRGDIDLVCSDLHDFIIIEVKGTSKSKHPKDLLRLKQTKNLVKKARSAALSLGLFPENGRLDLLVVDFSRKIPRIEWIQEVERFHLFPVLKGTDH